MRDRRAHPLLGVFPLAVMALGTLLVTFALAMAQLNAATDRDIPTSASKRLVATSSDKAAATLQPAAARARTGAHGTAAIPPARDRPDF